MKTINVCALFFLISTTIIAQEKGMNEKKTTYGFGFGLNYSEIFMNEIPQDLRVQYGTAFHVGIHVNHSLNEKWSVSPKIELAKNRNTFSYFKKVNVWNQEHWVLNKYHIMPMALYVMTHLRFQPKSGDNQLYFLVGPNVKIPIILKGNQNSQSSVVDLAVDFGVGFDKRFNGINFLPELRYSLGLMDVNNNPKYGSVYLHNITLILQFSG